MRVSHWDMETREYRQLEKGLPAMPPWSNRVGSCLQSFGELSGPAWRTLNLGEEIIPPSGQIGTTLTVECESDFGDSLCPFSPRSPGRPVPVVKLCYML